MDHFCPLVVAWEIVLPHFLTIVVGRFKRDSLLRKKQILSLLSVTLVIHLDYSGVSCQDLDISTTEMSGLAHHKTSPIKLHHVQQKADISTAHISQTPQEKAARSACLVP